MVRTENAEEEHVVSPWLELLSLEFSQRSQRKRKFEGIFLLLPIRKYDAKQIHLSLEGIVAVSRPHGMPPTEKISIYFPRITSIARHHWFVLTVEEKSEETYKLRTRIWERKIVIHVSPFCLNFEDVWTLFFHFTLKIFLLRNITSFYFKGVHPKVFVVV